MQKVAESESQNIKLNSLQLSAAKCLCSCWFRYSRVLLSFIYFCLGGRGGFAIIVKKINCCTIYLLANALLEGLCFLPSVCIMFTTFTVLVIEGNYSYIFLFAGAPAVFSPGNLSTSSSASSTLGSPDNDEYILSFETIDKMRRVSSYSSLNSLIGMFRFILKICTLELKLPLHLMR